MVECSKEIGKPTNTPLGYPLPWCAALGEPYYQINLCLCDHREGWRERQAYRDMAEIIPEIDRMIASGSVPQAA